MAENRRPRRSGGARRRPHQLALSRTWRPQGETCLGKFAWKERPGVRVLLWR